MFARILDAINRGSSIDSAVAEEAARVHRELACLLDDEAHLPLLLEMTSGSPIEVDSASKASLGPRSLMLCDQNGQMRVMLALIHVTSVRALGME